jgi:hypothetical protein
MVDRCIDCHAIEISRETGFPLKILYGSEKFDEDFLNNIKRFLSLSQHSIGNPINLLMVPLKDLP